MTRINVVPVCTLSGPHLVAEYRELPRVFGLAHKASQSSKPWTHKQPKAYTMGTGHVLFFYDKLGYLVERHKELVQEMLCRGFKPRCHGGVASPEGAEPAYTGSLEETWGNIPKSYWKAYTPSKEALEINQARIDERNRGK